VVDIVNQSATISKLDKVANGLKDVVLGKNWLFKFLVDLELVVQLQTANLGKVIALWVEEEIVEEGLGGLNGRRIAWAKSTIDFLDGFVWALQLVGAKCVAQEATNIETINEKSLNGIDAVIAKLGELLLAEFLVER
jgi:hypothetical protein